MAADYPRPWRGIADDLRRKVLAGRWQPGDRLPTVGDLSAEYGRSKNTIRLAINQLVAEGLLSTRVGSGIYVERRGIEDAASNHPDET